MCNEPEKLQVMLKMAEVYWTNFNRRRGFEWKFSMSIWTALAAFIAISFREGAGMPSVRLRIGLVVGAILIWVVQMWFLRRVTLANRADKAKALFYEYAMKDILLFKFDQDVKKALVDLKSWDRPGDWWSCITQLAITLVLIALAILVQVWPCMTAKADSHGSQGPPVYMDACRPTPLMLVRYASPMLYTARGRGRCRVSPRRALSGAVRQRRHEPHPMLLMPSSHRWDCPQTKGLSDSSEPWRRLPQRGQSERRQDA